MEGGRRPERNYCTRLHFGSHLSMAELPLVQVLQQQLAHVTSEREDLHGGAIASSDSWDLLQRRAAFGAHSRCIQSAGSLYEIPASNLWRAHLIQKSSYEFVSDVSWYSWFWLAFCFSGLMHLWERCSKRVGWRIWSSRRRLIQSKRRAEQDAARSLRACKSWIFDISKSPEAKLHLFSVCATEALETTEAQITELLASANVLSQVFWGPTDGRNDGCSWDTYVLVIKCRLIQPHQLESLRSLTRLFSLTNFWQKKHCILLQKCWEQMAAELDTGDRLQGRHCWTASGLIELHRHRPHRFEHLIFRSFQWGSTYFYLFVELWQPSGTRETTWHHPQRFPCFKAARKRCKGSKTPIPRWLKTQCYEIEVESIDPYRSF